LAFSPKESAQCNFCTNPKGVQHGQALSEVKLSLKSNHKRSNPIESKRVAVRGAMWASYYPQTKISSAAGRARAFTDSVRVQMQLALNNAAIAASSCRAGR
jgi:hypothetical protein